MSRTLRIVTGIILFAFVTTHLLNLSLGLISLEVLDNWRPVFSLPWTNPVGFLLLAGSMVIHATLGLVAIYWRNTLQMTRYDLLQMVSALLIFPLLVPHVLGVTLLANMLNAQPDYTSLLMFFWVQVPVEGLRQVLVVAVTWIHGCVGLFTWMRLYAWWPTVSLIAYPLAVLVPVLALLGFVEAGNQVMEIARITASTAQPPSAEAQAQMASAFAFFGTVVWTSIGVYCFIVAAVFVARAMRLRSSGTGILTLSYLTGDKIRTEGGVTLLEAAQINDLPHANLCQGRGRCGTCRVRIISSSEPLPEASELEKKTLARFASPDNVRLACQLTASAGEIELERLLSPDVGTEALVPPSGVSDESVSAEQGAVA